jgi:hypothetical protein
MIFQGQITGLVLAGLAVGFWSLETDRALLGGLVCSLTLVKPELALLPVCTLVVLSLLRKKHQFPLGVLLGSLVLVLVSMALVGFWFAEWFDALVRYSLYAKVVWPVSMLFDASPFLGILALLIMILAVYSIRHSADYLFSLSIALSYLLLPQTLIWGLSLLLVPMNLLWTRQTRIPIILVWLAGWGSIFGNLTNANPNWWMVQVILFSLSILALVFYSRALTSREKRALRGAA